MDQRYEPQQHLAPIPGEMPLSATLTAAEWNLVQTGLRELPMKYVEQLTQKIARQVFAQAYERAPFSTEQQEQQP